MPGVEDVAVDENGPSHQQELSEPVADQVDRGLGEDRSATVSAPAAHLFPAPSPSPSQPSDLPDSAGVEGEGGGSDDGGWVPV